MNSRTFPVIIIALICGGILDSKTLPANDVEKAFEKFQKTLKVANTGDFISCFMVASMLESGVNGPRDYEKALEFYEKSGEGGYPIAWLKYGELQERIDPTLIKEDFHKKCTIAMQKKIASGEELKAEEMYLVGKMYAEGIGTYRKDIREARGWWVKAKEAGDENALYQIAITDISLSETTTTRADGLTSICSLASRGHPLSIAVLNAAAYGSPAGLNPRWNLSILEERIVTKALNEGLDALIDGEYLDDGFKTFYVADFQWAGVGFDQNEENAIATWKRCFELGNFKAADMLIAIYTGIIGDGRFEDIAEARNYLEIRSRYGDIYSVELLSSLNSGVEPGFRMIQPLKDSIRLTFSGRN